MSQKIRVAVVYGGRSGEHEISLRSAASVIRNLDRTRFEIVPVAIDKQGQWHLVDPGFAEKEAQGASLSIPAAALPVVLPPDPSRGKGKAVFVSLKDGSVAATADVVFPVMHGPLCEDGTIQGILELAEVAYVGCGVAASSVGMDKDMAKRLARDAGIPIVPFVMVRAGRWREQKDLIRARVKKELGFPCFVKPVNMGSSVGVHKVKDEAAFDAAMNDAFRYDTKVLVEKAISAREIEVSVLESRTHGAPARASVAGEIIPSHEFYSYEAKYLDDDGAALLIPARLSSEELARVQKLAVDVFEALEGEGLSRVDFFLDKISGQFYFNEVNTIPGFTSISMYPKMWEASGLGYAALLSELVDLALERQRRKGALLREFAAAKL
ncbi:MAG: D-alanine--D-alanine ligase [Bdellovibrionales bacterium]|nr:D-alanine--D-alanine ligase [Bdellovibrionales bacterium]